MYNILIADDEKEIIKLLKIYLESEQFRVYEAYDGEEACAILEREDIDLAIVDIMMPRVDGYELIKRIRKERYIPIMVISAKTSLSDRILGIDLGADDYITKPFEPLEVTAKVKAHFRRVKSQIIPQSRTLRAGNLTLNCDECVIMKNDRAIELTKVEFLVMEMFMEQPGRVFTREQIYERGWNNEAGVDDNTIRVIISRLRDKIGNEYIKTIRGLGYRLEKHE